MQQVDDDTSAPSIHYEPLYRAEHFTMMEEGGSGPEVEEDPRWRDLRRQGELGSLPPLPSSFSRFAPRVWTVKPPFKPTKPTAKIYEIFEESEKLEILEKCENRGVENRENFDGQSKNDMSTTRKEDKGEETQLYDLSQPQMVSLKLVYKEDIRKISLDGILCVQSWFLSLFVLPCLLFHFYLIFLSSPSLYLKLV